MTGINHKQAQRYLRAAADGLLRENQRALLAAHLRECDSCRAEADEFNALEARLQKNFQARWDASDGPSTNVMTTIQSRSRRIIMTNRINTGLKVVAGIAALLVLVVLLNSALGKIRNSSVPAGATQTVDITQSTQPSGLIAYVSMQDGGNREIFTMKADGSGVTNLTNNPATDEYPIWSPDGTQIAFESDRSGDTDIYVMKADGSNVSRLTDDRGFEGNFSWSPDGQKIAYTSGENSLNDAGQLIVMNADGSNKIALTSALGSYTFLDWSPDSQKIVYQIPNFGYDENDRIIIANVDGTSTFDGITGIDFGVPRQFRWENPEQVVLLGYNFNAEPPTWQLSRMFITSDTTVYNRFGPTIVTSNSPIVAVFDKTYVVESQDALTWFVYEGAPIPFSPWRFSEICKLPTDPLLEETAHTISPDKQHDFVQLRCPEGTTYFFLANSDGTEIQQLGKPITNTNYIPFDVSWSSDGKYVSMPIADRQNQDIYLFDIEKMLNDPSTQPVQLTTDGTLKYGAVWQPKP